MPKYTIGLAFGTNSVRTVVVNTTSGKELATSTWKYEHGTAGIIRSSKNPALARQHPADYLTGVEKTIKRVLTAAKRSNKNFSKNHVVGLGISATGSTPIPVDRRGVPLAFQKRFEDNLSAMAWLWNDSTASDAADFITNEARKIRPQYLSRCGESYRSEWFFSKIFHCLRTTPKVFEAAYSWVEAADWIPAVLTGTEDPDTITIGACAAGHKAMYNDQWGGYPDEKFLMRIDRKLAELRKRLGSKAKSIGQPVGTLSAEWAKRTKLPEGISVSVSELNEQSAAVGAGIKPGEMVKILGDSNRDMVAVPAGQNVANVPGLCGIVNNSILPDHIGLEACQVAMDDLFNWFKSRIRPGNKNKASYTKMVKESASLSPGQNGLLSLDWNNGNRSVLADKRLRGLLLGQTLQTTHAEIFRAMVEATAFGALTIIHRFEQYHVKIAQIITCGSLAVKNPMVMQILADVTNRPIKTVRTAYPSALGAAIGAAVAAGQFQTIPEAQEAMTALKRKIFKPDPAAVGIYKKLYKLYKQLHDCFGTTSWRGNCYNVMKELIDIQTEAMK